MNQPICNNCTHLRGLCCELQSGECPPPIHPRWEPQFESCRTCDVEASRCDVCLEGSRWQALSEARRGCATCAFSGCLTSQEPCGSCDSPKWTNWKPEVKPNSWERVEKTTLAEQYPHYHKKIPDGVKTVDVYRVLDLFGVTDPCLQHAIKKLLVAGGRGAKDIEKDVAEAGVSLRRWQEMREEEKS